MMFFPPEQDPRRHGVQRTEGRTEGLIIRSEVFERKTAGRQEELRFPC